MRAARAFRACAALAFACALRAGAAWAAASPPPSSPAPAPTPVLAPGPAEAGVITGTFAPDNADPFDTTAFDASGFDATGALDSASGPDGAVPSRAVGAYKQAFAADGTLSDPGTAPALILLPMAITRGSDTDEAARAAAGLRLGLAESGRFAALTAEAAARAWPGGRLPAACFDARCLAHAAAAAPVPLVLLSDFAARDGRWTMRLVLAQAHDGRIRRALQVWAKAAPGGLVPFAREAGLRLATPDAQGPGVDGALFADGGARLAESAWHSIPWLNPRDSIDHRARAGWAGAGLLAAGAALAYAQGQLTGADGNASAPARDLASSEGAPSFLRGFFADPPLGARYAAMGGAGLAAVGDAMALLMNPAGVARAEREDVAVAKRSLPDGTPSFFVAYAGPLYHGWHQGLGARYEGDRLANETTAFGTLACDLGQALGTSWEGVKAGASLKFYLAQAGEGGTGLDRSTGHSYGMGFDAGAQAPLGERITAALSVRDLFGFLRHANTFTDRSYGEVLPSEWKIGAAYRAGGGLILLLDGQKAVWADEADHLRVGGEQVLRDFLALRAGLHETFGRETTRAIAVGFGLDSGGLKETALKVRLSLDYAFEFGLDADAPLAGGQQFSLVAGF